MISQGNSHSVAQESSEIWADQVDLQPISFKSDRLRSAVRKLRAQSAQIFSRILA
jgi:hypothetical protein